MACDRAWHSKIGLICHSRGCNSVPRHRSMDFLKVMGVNDGWNNLLLLQMTYNPLLSLASLFFALLPALHLIV